MPSSPSTIDTLIIGAGGYAYLTPGGGAARQMLGTPVHERLYFAGEAVAQELAQTCGGAFLSGQQAAAQIIQRRR